VLLAVAAAVIGGTSLFGGRGKTIHGVLGGLVIGGIYNGLYLLGVQSQWIDVVVAAVLLAAALIDVLSRRGGRGKALSRRKPIWTALVLMAAVIVDRVTCRGSNAQPSQTGVHPPAACARELLTPLR
jgi:hypothetical protein